MCEEHLSLLSLSLTLRSMFIEQTGEHAVPFVRTSLHTVTGRGCFGWREILNASWKLGLFVAANRISPGSLKRRHPDRSLESLQQQKQTSSSGG